MKYISFINKYKFLYYILQFTYGIVMNIIGSLLALIMLISFHKCYKYKNNIIFEFKKFKDFGFSCGMFIFVCKDCESIFPHESGHSMQNIIFGPLFLFIVAIPSVIRFWYREFKYYRKNNIPHTKYDDIWFEGQATKIGQFLLTR